MVEDGSLFSKKGREGEVELPTAKKGKHDLYVSPGNSLSRKMVEPYGENELDGITLENLWLKASRGDDHCPRFTEFAINDPNYKGLALSKSMENLVVAIKQLMLDDEAGQIFDKKIYTKMKEECAQLLPHLIVLSGGQMRKEGGGRLNAYKVATVDPGLAEAAAKYVYAWLTNGSNLRSILKFLSKGGVFYTAFANEKLTRAYIVAENVKENDFLNLCLHRLCPPDAPRSVDGSTDWGKMKAE